MRLPSTLTTWWSAASFRPPEPMVLCFLCSESAQRVRGMVRARREQLWWLAGRDIRGSTKCAVQQLVLIPLFTSRFWQSGEAKGSNVPRRGVSGSLRIQRQAMRRSNNTLPGLSQFLVRARDAGGHRCQNTPSQRRPDYYIRARPRVAQRNRPGARAERPRRSTPTPRGSAH